MAEEKKDIEGLVDEALSGWSRVEPEPGLESRVLARLREEAARGASRPPSRAVPVRPAVRRATALAAAALVVLAAALALRLRTSAPPPSPPGSLPVADSAAAPAGRPAPAPPAPAAEVAEVAAAAPRPAAPGVAAPRPRPPALVRRPDRGPRGEVFPAPSPLGEQGRLLLAYVERTPLEEVLVHKGLLDPPAEPGTGPGAEEEETRPANGPAFARPVI